MFYLQLKDGRTLATDLKSDDRVEFRKLLDSELGGQVVELFDTLIQEASEVNTATLNRYKRCITGLNKEINKPNIDKDRIAKILVELKDIYIDLS